MAGLTDALLVNRSTSGSARRRADPSSGGDTAATTPAKNGDAAAATPATQTDVAASRDARILAIILLGVGILIAVLVTEKDAAFKPAEGFALFTGFYIAAQAIERLLELIPAGTGSKQAKADRAVIFPGIAFILAVILAEKLGLFYLQAVGLPDASKDLDIIITGLAIGGGTKPLHDAIKGIEKAKETPPGT